MRVLVVLLVLTASALTGCAGQEEDGPEDGATGTSVDGAETPLTVPEWTVGDHWTYETNFGATWTLVVSEDAGSDWVVDTDDANLAFFHDQNEVSYLGLVSKADLAGSQGGQRVSYFDFPLEDGKQWTTLWDGEQMQVTATRTGPDAFTFEARVAGAVRYTYAYDNDTRFLDDLVGYDGGNRTFEMRLTGSGTGFTGELLRVDARSFFTLETSGPGADTAMFSGWAPPEDSEVYLMADIQCQQGEVMFAIGAVESLPNTAGVPVTDNDDGMTWQSVCPLSVTSFFARIGVEPAQGTWGYTWHLASQDATLAATAWFAEYERITL